MWEDRRQIAFRLLVILTVIAGLVFGVGWRELFNSLATANPILALIVPLGALAAVLAGAEGTRIAMGFPSRGPRASLARRAFVGAAIVRALLPAGNVGSGGFITFAVSRHREVTVSEALAGVTAWEIVMMGASAIVGGVGFLLLSARGTTPIRARNALIVVGGLFSGIVLVIASLSVFRESVARILVRITEAIQPLTERLPITNGRLDIDSARAGIDRFYTVMASMVKAPRKTLTILVVAHLTWLCWIVPVMTSLEAIGTPVSLPVAMVAVTASGLARAIPLPTGIGPVDAALGGLLVILTPYGITQLAPALVLNRAGTLLVQVSLGGAALWQLNRPINNRWTSES